MDASSSVCKVCGGCLISCDKVPISIPAYRRLSLSKTAAKSAKLCNCPVASTSTVSTKPVTSPKIKILQNIVLLRSEYDLISDGDASSELEVIEISSDEDSAEPKAAEFDPQVVPQVGKGQSSCILKSALIGKKFDYKKYCAQIDLENENRKGLAVKKSDVIPEERVLEKTNAGTNLADVPAESVADVSFNINDISATSTQKERKCKSTQELRQWFVEFRGDEDPSLDNLRSSLPNCENSEMSDEHLKVLRAYMTNVSFDKDPPLAKTGSCTITSQDRDKILNNLVENCSGEEGSVGAVSGLCDFFGIPTQQTRVGDAATDVAVVDISPAPRAASVTTSPDLGEISAMREVVQTISASIADVGAIDADIDWAADGMDSDLNAACMNASAAQPVNATVANMEWAADGMNDDLMNAVLNAYMNDDLNADMNAPAVEPVNANLADMELAAGDFFDEVFNAAGHEQLEARLERLGTAQALKAKEMKLNNLLIEHEKANKRLERFQKSQMVEHQRVRQGVPGSAARLEKLAKETSACTTTIEILASYIAKLTEK